MAEEFLAYCKCNPHLRFWQALLSWSGLTRIMEVTGSISGIPIRHLEMKDTFYWVGKNK